MNSGFLRQVRFQVERWVQRGVVFQLLFMATLVVLVAITGGIAAWSLTSAFDNLWNAIWWSFLRLTDPGYLGDDEGAVLRIISTTVTILGYVLFMGSLIAIMTQWLATTIRKLESGLTPISMQNHFVILGWTNRTPEIIKKLLTAAGRLERFFARRGTANKLRVVVLAEEVNAELRVQLRESLGEDWDESRVFLRSGSSLHHEDLERLDLMRAAVVMIPGADFELGGAELTDTRVIKTLLTLDALMRRRPYEEGPQVVAELFDPRKVFIARNSIESANEIIASDRLISRLLSQSLRHPGVATVLLSLVRHGVGNTIYLRSFAELAGRSPWSLQAAFEQAVVLGVVTETDGELRAHLDPTDPILLAETDLLILVAERYDRCRLTKGKLDEGPRAVQRALPTQKTTPTRRLLVLGWSYKAPTLIAELQESKSCHFDITFMSRVDLARRERAFAHLEFDDHVRLRHLQGDYSLEQDLRALKPESFDHVLFLASSWMNSSDEADARTVLGIVLLRSLLKSHSGTEPEILVELLDPANARILSEGSEAVFVSPQLLSHLLAHVALRPELNTVFEELIGAEGAELDLLVPDDLGLPPELSFGEAQTAAADFGCVAVGFLTDSPTEPAEAHLNPARDERRQLREHDRIVVLRS